MLATENVALHLKHNSGFITFHPEPFTQYLNRDGAQRNPSSGEAFLKQVCGLQRLPLINLPLMHTNKALTNWALNIVTMFAHQNIQYLEVCSVSFVHVWKYSTFSLPPSHMFNTQCGNVLLLFILKKLVLIISYCYTVTLSKTVFLIESNNCFTCVHSNTYPDGAY